MVAAAVVAALALSGAVAVVAFITALGAPKGGELHRRAGGVFTATVLLAGGGVVPLAWWIGDVFLAMVALLCVWLVHAGRREVIRHRRGAPPSWPDHLGLAALIAAGLALLALAASLDAELVSDVVFLVQLAALLIFLALSEWRRLRRPPGPHGWLLQHVGAMGVAGVLVATVLGIATHRTLVLPAWVGWFGPAVLGVPVVLRWLAQVRAHGPRATFL